MRRAIAACPSKYGLPQRPPFSFGSIGDRRISPSVFLEMLDMMEVVTIAVFIIYTVVEDGVKIDSLHLATDWSGKHLRLTAPSAWSECGAALRSIGTVRRNSKYTKATGTGDGWPQVSVLISCGL